MTGSKASHRLSQWLLTQGWRDCAACDVPSFLVHAAKLPIGQYILPSIMSSFLTWDKLSHDVLDRFSRSFHQLISICVHFLDPDLFFIPLGTLPWQPILGKICEMTFIQHAGILQRIQISQFRFRNDKGHTIFATFCAILMKIGTLTPKISQWVSVPFGTRWQKSTCHTKYLSKYWTKLR